MTHSIESRQARRMLAWIRHNMPADYQRAIRSSRVKRPTSLTPEMQALVDIIDDPGSSALQRASAIRQMMGLK